MHPDDAQRLGLSEGDTVRASNAQGSAQFTLTLTARTAPGRVVSEGVWWNTLTKTGNTNQLTHARTTDKDDGSTFYDVKVNISKI